MYKLPKFKESIEFICAAEVAIFVSEKPGANSMG